MRLRKLATFGIFLVVAIVGAACNGTGPTEPAPEDQSALRSAQSCDQVREQIVDSTTEQILKQRYRRRVHHAAAPQSDGERSASAGQSSAGSKSPDDYTETNTQEEGVDEADIVKTDGDYIYTVDGDELVILDSWPAEETSIVGRYDIDGTEGRDGRDLDYSRTSVDSLFLQDDRVAVFSHVYGRYDDGRDHEWFNATRITVLDVSDRSDPTALEKLEIEGSMVSGRMIDGHVYLVSRGDVSPPIDVWQIARSDDNGLPPRGATLTEGMRERRVREARPQVRELVRERLRGTSVAEMMPQRRYYENGELSWSRPLYSCTDLYVPPRKAKLGVLSVSHFDFDAPGEVTSTGLLAEGWTVYASKKNLYVAMSSRAWFWGWGWRDHDSTSHIHKFALDGVDRAPRYAASGEVDGWLLDQFAMDEHDGHLRVASTESGAGPQGDEEDQSQNHLTVLEQRGRTLKTVGSLRGLASGERIYAVRMSGDEGYIVTYRTIDPLFTLDLSDPKAPTVRGELKITGFSSYIHPLGEDHLMTIGKDADQEGRVQGVQLQIFDVSDMTDPVRIHRERISTGEWSSWSEAMWNHHAFTYHPERDMLAFPVNIDDWSRTGGSDFSGLLLYEANAEEGFTPVGRVSHGDLDGEDRWWTTVRRSLFIEDYVYSLSERGLKVNDLRAPERERAAASF